MASSEPPPKNAEEAGQSREDRLIPILGEYLAGRYAVRLLDIERRLARRPDETGLSGAARIAVAT